MDGSLPANPDIPLQGRTFLDFENVAERVPNDLYVTIVQERVMLAGLDRANGGSLSALLFAAAGPGGGSSQEGDSHPARGATIEEPMLGLPILPAELRSSPQTPVLRYPEGPDILAVLAKPRQRPPSDGNIGRPADAPLPPNQLTPPFDRRINNLLQH